MGAAPLDQGRVRLGHDILVFDRDRGKAQAQLPGGALRVVAGGCHHMLRRDFDHLVGGHKVAAAFHHAPCRHDPMRAGPPVGVHLPAPFDADPVLPGAARHRLGHVGGVDVAIGGMKQRALQILCAQQRPTVCNVIGRQPFKRDAHRFRRRGV